MSLELKINEAIKASMLAKDKVRLESLRAIKAAILLAKTADGAQEISDADVLKIMQKLVKQRRESAETYRSAGRDELAAAETAEAVVIEEFLPKSLSADELETELRKIIAEVGAQSPADMGKVMKAAQGALAGRADGRAISECVKNLLAK